MRVEIYSDIACPWCYVGERRFFQARDALPNPDAVEAVFRPYQLDPTLSDRPVPLPDRLREKFGPQYEAVMRRTAEAARQDGLDLRFGDALAVNTLAAHRLLHLALEEAGATAQREIAEALFEAHFTRGLNVADYDVLAEVAARAGMDRDTIRARLEAGEGREAVHHAIERAHRLGIRAVPTFVFGGRMAVQGAQPVEVFRDVLARVLTPDAPDIRSPGRPE